MRYFKCGRREHIDAMINEGLIRLGSLHEYRTNEHEAIRDALEGKGGATFKVPTTVMSHGKIEFLGQTLIDVRDSEDITVEGGSMTFQNIELIDVYVYCVSNKASQSIMTKEGYNACVEILDIGRFIYELRMELHKQGFADRTRPVQANKCTYADNKHVVISRELDLWEIAFRKGHHDKYQEEFRMLFYPFRQPISPLLIKIPGIKPLLKEISFTGNAAIE